MTRLAFDASPAHTLGVEIELALVDARTMALSSANAQVLERVPAELRASIKPELMQCYVELNTDVCRTVAEAEADLRGKLQVLEEIADGLGLRPYWSATHPFSSWHDQEVTEDQRYKGLVNLLQDTARQLITFGLHVHVGVDSGDKAVMICDRILSYLPLLLAASCNSPFWEGRVTGLQSWRSRVMDALPTAGLPPLMRNWSEYVWLINHLIATGYIESIREVWWDVRPHHNFGTVEVRICDIPGSLEDTLALVALTQCLVKKLSDQIDEGAYQHDCHPMMVRQNKWHAARYGLDAELVHATTYQQESARQIIRKIVDQLQFCAEDLGCLAYLNRAAEMADRPNWSQRQVDLLGETGDPAEVVRRMTDLSRISKPAAAPRS
ncbi:MAG: YbdK family carboxylate-amine ligase [Phycisphaerae bacterium]|nr:YbdK family carboxylate-amine ligase [Phycisphaerae bacterium]